MLKISYYRLKPRQIIESLIFKLHNMDKKNKNFRLLRTSTKFLEFTRGKCEVLRNKNCKLPSKLPPITKALNLKSKQIAKCQSIPMGTMSIIKPDAIKNRKYKYFLRNSLTKSTRSKLKIKTIHWILSQYREEIDRLLENCKTLIMQTNYRGDMNYTSFEDVISSISLGVDKTLIDRLFWIFDEDGSGTIDMKEVMVGLEMFRETSFKEKLEVFFDICDEDGSGDIDEEEFYNVLKLCVNTPKERKLLKDSLHDLFIAIDEDGNGLLTKDEIIKAATHSEAMKSIIEKSIMTCQGVDSWIASDFYTNPSATMQGSYSSRANGVSHIEIDRFYEFVREEEGMYEQDRRLKEENKKRLLLWKTLNEHRETSFDDEEKEIIIGADGRSIEY